MLTLIAETVEAGKIFFLKRSNEATVKLVYKSG